MKVMDLARAGDVVRQQRAGQRDVYAELADLELRVRDPMAELPLRYSGLLTERSTKMPVRLSPTAIRQVCGIAGVPMHFLAKTPAAMGLSVLRCHLAMAQAQDGRKRLFRLKQGRLPTVRAVLPSSFVRFDDVDALDALSFAVGSTRARVADIKVDDDTCFLRVLTGEEMPLGATVDRDTAYAGFDVITSETGRRPLELRSVLFRVICTNGITTLSEAQEQLKARYTAMDRIAFVGAVQAAIDEALAQGGERAAQFADTRLSYVRDPAEEVARIFRRHRLGSPRGRIGRWVSAEVARHYTPIAGVQRYDVINAFTAVARGLGHRDRVRIEDAMGAYLAAEVGHA